MTKIIDQSKNLNRVGTSQGYRKRPFFSQRPSQERILKDDKSKDELNPF